MTHILLTSLNTIAQVVEVDANITKKIVMKNVQEEKYALNVHLNV